MFDSILIANRGEIACRVVRTCRRLGIRTIAVYSDADADARHVREADVAVRIGAAPARESYLDAQRIVGVAIEHGAEAIHPGYGFLSEKLELIDACQRAGLVFIGPHREAIARMGSKIESKRLARAAGVPCVPGYDGEGGNDHGDGQSDIVLTEAARAIGFPLLIKASAGGGGKGMKRVDEASAFASQLAAARGEALAAFGDDRVLLERFVERPRHLEVQLLGDLHGGLVHLFERECSIQRNYQKLIEEAPAAHLSDAVRTKLFDASLKLGRAIGYDSAGTVEFVLAAGGDEPWFLEMNTRLQVEHPVTELTVKDRGVVIDLVEQQIRSAAGEPLTMTQDSLVRDGWAIEARVNAEVPDDDFRASFGRVSAYEEPRATGVRIDSGIDQESTITPHYDAMLAKVIGSGATREVAKTRLLEGLATLRIEGIRTNQALLAEVVCHPAFDAMLTTRFLIDAFEGGWSHPHRLQHRAAAVAAWFFARSGAAQSTLPLDALIGLRLTAAAGRRGTSRVVVGADDDAVELSIEALDRDRVDVVADDMRWRAVREGDRVRIDDRRVYLASCREDAIELWCAGDWSRWPIDLAVHKPRRRVDDAAGGNLVVAVMPGVVTRILVARDAVVTAGMPVAVIEAMKLLHTLTAPRDGVVASIQVVEGETVDRGRVLVELA
jgi:3-methylcrotonyl-CoA carboxylase alpha subunit